MITAVASYDWLFWGIALMLGLPLLVVAFGEVAQALERRGSAHLRKPLDMVRHSCLILLFFVILLRWVVGLPGEHLAVKVVDTAFWITVINAAMVLFNAIIFAKGATDWRANAPKLLIDLGRLFLLAFGGALVVSHVWNVDLRGLLAALGVGSLVIGLALQDTLGNVFSGIAMISARQFKVNDWIRVGDVEGQVRSINWRTVTVGALTGDLVVIPNSQIARDRLRVLGADAGFLRVATDVKVSYEHPPERVFEILLEAAAATKDVLADPKPTARLISHEDYAILYRVAFCIREFRNTIPVRSEFLTNAWYLAERNGLAFPARYNDRYHLPPEIVRHRQVPVAAMAERLHNSGAFQRPLEALLPVVANARIEIFRKGETLLGAGIRGRTAYVIVNGTANAVSISDGKETVVGTFAAGDLILFKAFLRGGGSPFTVRPTADVEAIAIPITDLEAVLSTDPRLAHEVERILALREDSAERSLAKSGNGHAYGSAENADRVQILKDLFRV